MLKRILTLLTLFTGLAAAQTNVTKIPGDLYVKGRSYVTNSPLTAMEVAPKQYVDAVSAGLKFKDPVATATTANITLSGEQTIDGVLTSASRVLVKNQTTGSQNGIYVSAAGAWARSTDMDADAEIPGALTFVSAGSVNGGKQFVVSTPSPITVGVTSIAWAIFFQAERADLAGTSNQISLSASGTDVLSGSTNITLSLPQNIHSAATPTFAGATLSGLTASLPVFTNGSSALTTNAITGTGNVMMSASPTTTGTLTGAAANFSGAVSTGALSATSANLSSSLTFAAGQDIIIQDNSASALTVTEGGNAYLRFVTTNSGEAVNVFKAASLTSTLNVTGATTLTALAGSGTRMVTADATGVLSTSTSLPSAGFANPTGTIGLTAVNGVATTAMRSDAAPALSQAISPTWSGTHTFSNTITATGGVSSPDGQGLTTEIGGFTRDLAARSGTTLSIGENGGWTAVNYNVSSGGSHQFGIAGTTRFSVVAGGGVVDGGLVVSGTGSAEDAKMYVTASTGLTLRGKAGSSYDLDLVTPAGTSVLRAPTGTNTAQMPGAATVGGTLGVTGIISSAEALSFTGNGSEAAGRIYRSAGNGLELRGVTGSVLDFGIKTAGGNLIFDNPTGTNNIRIGFAGASTYINGATVRLAGYTTQYTVPFITNSSGDLGTSTSLTFNSSSNTFGTENATVSGTAIVTGVLTASSGVQINGGTFAAGRIYHGGGDGLVISPKTGTTYDFSLVNTAGSAYLMRNPTGTNDLQFPSGTVSITNAPIFSSTSASRLLATNGSKAAVSVSNLADWIAGSSNITVTNDGDGTVSLNTVQDIDNNASPTFAGLVIPQLGVASSPSLLTIDNLGNVGNATTIGRDYTFSRSNSGGTNTLAIANTSNTASSAVALTLTNGGTSAGNAYMQFNYGGGDRYSLGVREFDDAFVLSNESALSSQGELLKYTSSEGFRFLSPVYSQSQLISESGRRVKTSTTSTNLTLDLSHDHVKATGTGGYTITLPAAASHSGRRYVILYQGTSTITIGRTGSDTINGVTSITLRGVGETVTGYAGGEFWSDGTEWNANLTNYEYNPS